MSTMKRFGLAVAVLTLSGCTGAEIYVQAKPNETTYEWSNFTKYHAGKETRVTIYGNPFGIDQTAFEHAVLRHMQGSHPGVPADFTTTPGPEADKYFHIVVAFNARSDGYALCARDKSVGASPAAMNGRITLDAVWCHETRPDSRVKAWTARPQGVDDPRFGRLVSQATRNLLSGRENVREDDDDDDGMP